MRDEFTRAQGLLVIGSLLAGLAAAECWLRVSDQVDSARRFALLVRSHDDAIVESSKVLRISPKFLWENIPNESGVDAQGFRMEPALTAAVAPKRVLFLGDSVTFGWNLPADSTYPARVQALGAGRFEALNSGVIGYSSFQGLLQLREHGPRLRPDVVVASFYANDEDDSCWTDRDLIERTKFLFDDSIIARTHLYQFVVVSWLKLAGGDPLGPCGEHRPTFRVPPEDFRRTMEEIARLSSKLGAKVVFVSQPANPLELEDPKLHAAYEEALTVAARSAQVPLLRLRELGPSATPREAKTYFLDHCHLTAQGSELVARALLPMLAEATR